MCTTSHRYSNLGHTCNREEKEEYVCVCEVGGFMFKKCKYSAPEIAILTNEKGLDTKTREL